jgi:hypothetical protein
MSRKEMESDSFTDTTSATTTLSGVGLSNESFNKSTDLTFLIEPHLAMLSGINYCSDIGDRDTSFGDVAARKLRKG